MQCSIGTYQLYWPTIQSDLAEIDTNFEYRRLDTWLRLDRRKVGRLIRPIAPGLMRQGPDAENLILAKPIVVAYMRSGTGSPSPERMHDLGESMQQRPIDPRRNIPDAGTSTKTKNKLSTRRAWYKGKGTEPIMQERPRRSQTSNASSQASQALLEPVSSSYVRRSSTVPLERSGDKSDSDRSSERHDATELRRINRPYDIVTVSPSGFSRPSTTSEHLKLQPYTQSPPALTRRQNGHH